MKMMRLARSIDVTGENTPLQDALRIVRRYGRVHAQGMYLDAAPADTLRALFNRNLTLSATCGETPEMTAECLHLMAAGKITAHSMLSAIASPSDATDIYDAVYRHPDRYVTCAFRW